MKYRVIVWLLVIGALGSCAEKIATETVSPDGNFTIIVKNRPAIDPPAQTVYIRDKRLRRDVQVARLKKDVDWVGAVHWREDSRVAGVLVSGVRVLIIDSQKLRTVSDINISPLAYGYPPLPSTKDFDFVDTNSISYMLVDKEEVHLPSSTNY